MSRFHPASADYHSTLSGKAGVCYKPVANVVSGVAKAVGGIFSTPKAPALPAPATVAPPPPVPTVDAATVAVQQQQQQEQLQTQKKGALATLLNTGNTQTGQQLGAAAPETTLKRFLGS